MNFDHQWERTVILELNLEYQQVCRVRKINLRPVVIQLFDSETVWGRFDAQTRTISISRKLIKNHSWQQVLGVFKHEMAHQLVFEKNPFEYEQKPHGDLFQAACHTLGVPAQFTKAQVGLQEFSLDWREDQTESPQDRMLDKVKKLLALASSTNEHEAGLAMKKVQEIYAQYNLDKAQISDRAQFVHATITHGKKRKNAWEQRIISLLVEHFFVEIITLQQFNAKTGHYNQAFELIGTRENVLMAEYVYYFLLNQLNYLVKQSPDYTRSMKSSFRLGILEGFSSKLNNPDPLRPPNQQEISVIKKALVKFKDDPFLDSYLREIYPRLVVKKTARRIVDSTAFWAGQKEGQKLVLSKPLESSKASGQFISSSRIK